MSRLDGALLDESMTLHENGIRDGDILLLSIVQTQTCDPSPTICVTPWSMHRHRQTATAK